jgi:hypothetical protein
MIYRCRFRVPVETDWSDVDAASPEDAAQDFHYHRYSDARGLYATRGIWTVHFALVEVDGYGELVSRVMKTGIYRKGGVKRDRPPQTIDEIARRLGWAHPVDQLFDSGWDGEELTA